MLVQEARASSSLKIVTAVLGTLLCADLLGRVIPFGSADVSAAPPQASASAPAAVAGKPQVPEQPTATATVAPPQVNAGAAIASLPTPREAEKTGPDGQPCEPQAWPYIDSRCKDADADTLSQANRQVRVIAKDPSTPATVMTPLPIDNAATRPEAQASPLPPRLPPSMSEGRLADNELRAADTPVTSSDTPPALPRRAPETIRQAALPTAATPAVPETTNSAVPNGRTFERSIRRGRNTAGVRENAREESPPPPKSTNQRSARSQRRDIEENSRRRKAEPRRTDITESRAYQLPSGRRIVVFRQANGEVGIAPDTRRSDSFFFGR
jgi:hypothetical protein